MDLRAYYKKMREIEASISEPYVVVVSLPTPDGGKPGVKTEVPRELAAKLIVNGQARLAEPQEAEHYYSEVAQARAKAERERLAHQIQVTLVAEGEEKKLMIRPRDNKGNKQGEAVGWR